MEVILIKNQWEQILKRHENKCNDIQSVMNKLIESGLTVTFGDVKDLINNGTALYNQAEQAAKSNASIFKLPKAKQKFIDENINELHKIIAESKGELNRILVLSSANPLNFEAFSIQKGIVSISGIWIEQLKESHTIRSTEDREKALRLMKNVEAAIQELNDFIKGNKFFGTGVTTFQDDRRSLVWLNGLGDINLDISSLEFI